MNRIESESKNLIKYISNWKSLRVPTANFSKVPGSHLIRVHSNELVHLPLLRRRVLALLQRSICQVSIHLSSRPFLQPTIELIILLINNPSTVCPIQIVTANWVNGSDLSPRTYGYISRSHLLLTFVAPTLLTFRHLQHVKLLRLQKGSKQFSFFDYRGVPL